MRAPPATGARAACSARWGAGAGAPVLLVPCSAGCLQSTAAGTASCGRVGRCILRGRGPVQWMTGL